MKIHAMFCCRGLEILADNAGSRGISLLVYYANDEFIFNIQARAVSYNLGFKHADIPIALPGGEENISVSSNIGLNYCPFCGTRLQSLINLSTRKDFEALAKKHRKFDERPY